MVIAVSVLGHLTGCDSSPAPPPVVATPSQAPGPPGPPSTGVIRDFAGEGMVGPGTGKLKWVASESEPGKLNVYTPDGTFNPDSVIDPWLIVVTRPRDQNIDKRKAATIKVSNDSKHFKDFQILSTTPVTIDGVEGYEILSQGEALTTPTMMSIYSVILFPTPNTYFIIRGQSTQADEDQWLPEFRTMAHGWKKPQ
jgi:hypothetical protein